MIGLLTTAFSLAIASPASPANPNQIVKQLEAYMREGDSKKRAELARRIERNPAYRYERVSEWLHAMQLWKPMKAGRQTVQFTTPSGPLDVLLTIPKGYDPAKPHALAIGLHGNGQTIENYADVIERIMTRGGATQFIYATPQQYQDLEFAQLPAAVGDNPGWWRELKSMVHVDGDRTFVTGFSLGGNAAWNWASLFADQWAGCITFGGTVSPWEMPRLVEAQLRNTLQFPVIHTSGENDRQVIGATYGRRYHLGRRNQVNREAAKVISKVAPNVSWFEKPDTPHVMYRLPDAMIKPLVKARRKHFPTQYQHTFRFMDHADSYWVRGEVWKGPKWGATPPEPIPGWDKPKDATDRALQKYLGRILARAERNVLTIETQNLSRVTVKLGDPLVNFARPVTVVANGKQRFRGRVQRSLTTALEEARRTADFDKLIWATFVFGV